MTRGTWIKGKKGDGVFRYNNSRQNQKSSIAGKEIRFKHQHIAVGGFPAEAYYEGSANKASVKIETVTGLDADNVAADAAMQRKLVKPSWRRPGRFIWNHAGGPGSKVMELVDKKTHRAVGHKGSAALPRAQLRAARAQGATSRVMGALTVYIVARDALRAGGVLKPAFEVGEEETYRFKSEDGSVFVVWPSSLWSNATIEFIDGPREGEEEEITDAEVEEYRKEAEKIWGKYIPGTWSKGERFIPGKKRDHLPITTTIRGAPYQLGYIDEHGAHYFPYPVPIPI